MKFPDIDIEDLLVVYTCWLLRLCWEARCKVSNLEEFGMITSRKDQILSPKLNARQRTETSGDN